MPAVLAIAAHPDDIEFVMAGTMLQLGRRGWDLHYFNIANGSRGSMVMDRQECARTRLAEAQAAAEVLGATFYPPICEDMEIFYSLELLQQVAAVVRLAQPQIILTHAPVDYMEDHEQACRLAVSAAFVKSMPNYQAALARTSASAGAVAVEPYGGNVTIYHAQPHGNRTPLGEFVRPQWIVDTGKVMEQKTRSLECHACQREWLDATQGMDSYVQTMRDLTGEVAALTGRYEYAEGWRRRQHWGFCGPTDDPLATALADCILPGKISSS